MANRSSFGLDETEWQPTSSHYGKFVLGSILGYRDTNPF